MATSKKAVVTAVKVNNKPHPAPPTKVVELIVKDGQLVPDERDLDAGVFSS